MIFGAETGNDEGLRENWTRVVPGRNKSGICSTLGKV
jgi:hypothetical protein